MKNPLRSLPTLPCLAFGACFLAATLSLPAQASGAPVPPSEQTEAVEPAGEKLAAFSYEDRDEFEKTVRQIAAGLDKQIAAIDPAGHGPAPVGRSRALLELQSARRMLDERMGRIELAIPENWDLIRDEVMTALAQVRTAYDKTTAS